MVSNDDCEASEAVMIWLIIIGLIGAVIFVSSACSATEPLTCRGQSGKLLVTRAMTEAEAQRTYEVAAVKVSGQNS